MARKGKKGNSKASAISDRSGVRYPMNEMVLESGTNWLVHYSESDGQYSLNRHPLNNMGRYLKGKLGDPYPVRNARPDIDWNEPMVYQGHVRMTGIAGMRSEPTVPNDGFAFLNGTASLIALAESYKLGLASLGASASMSANGLAIYTALTAMSASATFTAEPDDDEATASLTGTASLTATPIASYVGVVDMTASATLFSAIGILAFANLEASAELVISDVEVYRFGTSDLSGTATLTASALDVQFGASSLSASASLTATALDVQFGAATLSGTATLAASAEDVKFGAISMTASASLTATALDVKLGAVSMSGSASLTASALDVQFGSSSLSASASLTATALDVKYATVAMAASAALSGTTTVNKPGAASLSGSAAITASALDVQQAAATLSASASVSASALDVKSGAASLSGSAAITYSTWNVANAISVPPDFTSLPGSFPKGWAFSPDGTRMFSMSTSSTQTVVEYTLSPAWNTAGATLSGKSFNTTSVYVGNINFSSDGTKMFIGTISLSGSGSIYQYTLSTPWDLSTASYDSVSYNLASAVANVYDFVFSSDGTKAYATRNASGVDRVYQFNLGTAWNLSTISFTGNSADVNSQTEYPWSTVFKNDGTKMYVLSGPFSGSDRVYIYTLSTPWDITTASYDTSYFETGILGARLLRVDPNGSCMVTLRSNIVSKYSLELIYILNNQGFSSLTASADVIASADVYPFTATGGSITEAGGYRIHTFTSGGTFEVEYGSAEVEWLVVAGGGGGGGARTSSGVGNGGGGGGGGVRASSVEGEKAVGIGSYTVTVGSGGTGGGPGGAATNGGNSVFDDITALGGGAGGTYDGAAPQSGGSGGGRGYDFDVNPGGAGTAGQGNNGGSNVGGVAGAPNYASGGGGGATAVGGNGTSTTGGAGGAGLTSSISNSSVVYGSGGGGGAAGGTGGAGGTNAGSGTSSSSTPTAATANRGGGGGGSGNSGASTSTGGNAGSGIVIIRYPI